MSEIAEEIEAFCRDLVTQFCKAMQDTGVGELPYGDKIADDFERVMEKKDIENPRQAAENMAFSLLLKNADNTEMSLLFERTVLTGLPQFMNSNSVDCALEDLGETSNITKLVRRSGARLASAGP